MVSGIDIGTTDDPLKHPALPNEAPSPGLPGASRMTPCTLRRRKLAEVTPTTPAPITATVRLRPSLAIHRLGAAADLQADCMDRSVQDKVLSLDTLCGHHGPMKTGHERAAHHRYFG